MQKIVVLNASSVPDGTWTVTCVFWLTAPSNNKVPRPNFKSKVENVPSDVLLALESGDLVEQTVASPLYSPNFSLEDVREALITLYDETQANLDATNPPVANLVGTRFDGTSWTTS